MRLNQIFYKSRNYPKVKKDDSKIPFKELKPLILENKISSSIKNTKEKTCVYELALLFKCWSENEFNSKMCEQYVQNVQKCYKDYMQEAKSQKNLQKSDIPTAGSKNLTNKQYTYLLRQYPTV